MANYNTVLLCFLPIIRDLAWRVTTFWTPTHSIMEEVQVCNACSGSCAQWDWKSTLYKHCFKLDSWKLVLNKVPFITLLVQNFSIFISQFQMLYVYRLKCLFVNLIPDSPEWCHEQLHISSKIGSSCQKKIKCLALQTQHIPYLHAFHCYTA